MTLAPKLAHYEFDAVIAGLRLLAREMDKGLVAANDGDLGEILTNAGEHPGLTACGIAELCDRLLHTVLFEA